MLITFKSSTYADDDISMVEVGMVRRKLSKCEQIYQGVRFRCGNNENKKRIPTYIGCVLSDDWSSYGKFELWFNKNYTEGFHLDKDILVKGNKVYGPEFCRFVPQSLNNLLISRGAERGDCPQGVSKSKKDGAYVVMVRISGKQVYLGRFKNSKDASDTYVKAKEAHIKSEALSYLNDGMIDLDIYNSLINWRI